MTHTCLGTEVTEERFHCVFKKRCLKSVNSEESLGKDNVRRNRGMFMLVNYKCELSLNNLEFSKIVSVRDNYTDSLGYRCSSCQ